MSFVDKKETVVQIELTPFGKRKLAKGNFKPDHYKFFDDDIIYDNEYTGTEDGLNEAEDRIKQAIRLEPLAIRSGIETSFDVESQQIEDGVKDLFEVLRQSDNTETTEKLLSFPLGTMNLSSQDAPSFSLTSWGNNITSTTVDYNDSSNNGFRTPQIEMFMTHSVTRDATETVPVNDTLYNSESFEIDLTDEEITFLDGSKLTQETESLTISLDETGVSFLRENFDVELFEILYSQDPDSPGQLKEVLRKLDDPQEVLKYFDIQTDESVEEVAIKKKVNKNFFAN